MKKSAAFLMALLLMALPAMGLAEEMISLTERVGRGEVTIQYPSGWIALSAAIAKDLIANADEENIELLQEAADEVDDEIMLWPEDDERTLITIECLTYEGEADIYEANTEWVAAAREYYDGNYKAAITAMSMIDSAYPGVTSMGIYEDKGETCFFSAITLGCGSNAYSFVLQTPLDRKSEILPVVQRMASTASLSDAVLPEADTAELPQGHVLYRDPSDSYGFVYPEDWMLLDKENTEEILAQVDDLNPEYAALIESVRPQMEMAELVVLVHPSGTCNINMMREYKGERTTIEDMEGTMEIFKLYMPQMIPGMEFLTEAMAVEKGGKETMMIGYTHEMDGVQSTVVQALVSGETHLYTITLTADPNDQASFKEAADVMGLMIESAVL